jgi:hypothetical protein
MSKFLRVLDGNYNIKVQDGGEIKLDTGSQVGSVRITGNLIVEGDNTTVSSENTVFKDNIIVLNSPGKIYATFVGSITGNILTVTSIASGTILTGMSISWYDLAPQDSSIIGASQITGQVSGSLGGVGVYNIADTLSPAVSSRTITGEKLSSGGGSGVTLGTAGIRIDRGNLVDAQLLYDEALNPYNPDSATDGEGAFKLTYANGDPIGLRTNSISSGGDISLQPGGVVRVFKVNYESAVIAFGDNAIPNKKYVDDTITSSIFGLSYPKIERGDTEIRVRDSLASVATIAATGNGTTATLTFATQPFVLFEVGQLITVTGIDPVGYNGTHVVQAATASTVSYLNATTAGQTVAGTINDAVSKATIEIDGVLKNTFFANQVDFLQEQINLADIRIQESTISAPGTNSGDLVLQAQGTNSVRIDDTLMIKATGANPAHDGIGLKLYANTQGTGKTGLFYVNTSNIRDEIISKNRSLLFSMIF